MDDAEERLRDNLDGLDWLVPQLDGKPAGPRPTPRTPVPPPPAAKAAACTPATPRPSPRSLADARDHGRSPARGRGLRLDPKFACLSCHKVGDQGATVGPDLTTAGRLPHARGDRRVGPLAAAKVKEGYEAIAVATDDGKVVQGYKQSRDRRRSWSLRDAARASRSRLAKADDRGGPRRRHADARGPGRRDDARPSAGTWSGS